MYLEWRSYGLCLTENFENKIRLRHRGLIRGKDESDFYDPHNGVKNNQEPKKEKLSNRQEMKEYNVRKRH